jgi:hypothetical protein
MRNPVSTDRATTAETVMRSFEPSRSAKVNALDLDLLAEYTASCATGIWPAIEATLTIAAWSAAAQVRQRQPREHDRRRQS